MANIETSVSNLKINRLTQTQLENASSLSNTEAYWVDPEFTGGKVLATDSNGDIVETTVAPADIGTVKTVNNTSPDSNGNVAITIPSEVTETTVSNWGFTKNTGTVTSVNNVSPVSGNVTLSIPTQASDIGAVAISDCVDLAPVGSGWAMPSATYVDLTPGADGAQYQAPANGYFVIVSGTATNECWFVIRNSTTGLGNYVQAPKTYGLLRCSVAVKKNDYITVDYGNVPLDLVRFVYAVGSESEAS